MSEEFHYVPSAVSLAGQSFDPSFLLSDHVDKPPDVLKDALLLKHDAAWVRARIPAVFSYVPALSEVEKSLLDVGLIAANVAKGIGYPFICSDYYGSSRLYFSPEGPTAEVQTMIARGFWNLLLTEPDVLDDFSERVYHIGAGVWMEFGCNRGFVYCEESDD